ncbi:MAG: toll/interleukin-1 receptor domain-containing protein [Candidatus Thiodiazotropha sp. (ex Codakia rugifera)]|nr:toll/interleukin-1 receptor domain-containing protein [Candidatus Thiodiazotropha sp. (ex Codakia rugifera)]
MEYDVFISHASEDKFEVALPLVDHLTNRGLRVWIDEFELTLGDSLRRKINQGLVKSKYGVVILSPAFFAKEWPNKELDGLVARENGAEKVILPIWHNVSVREIGGYSPMLADKLAVSTSNGLDYVADQIVRAVKGSSIEIDPSINRLMATEDDILERLGHQMLTARSSSDLRYTLYELEEYMEKYPRSPQARMLKDRIEAGKRRAEELEAPRTLGLPKADAPMKARSVGIFVKIILGLLFFLVSVAAYIYIFFG